MVDYIADFLKAEIVPGLPLVPVLILVMFAFIVLMILKGRKKGDELEQPKFIEPEKEILEEFKDIATNGGGVPYKSMLMWGMIPQGRIVKWSPFKWEEGLPLKKLAKKNGWLESLRAEVEANKNPTAYVPDEFYLYNIIGKTLFHYIIYIFMGNTFNLAKERFFLIDRNFIEEKEGVNVYININAQPSQFYKGIYIFSREGKKVVQSMVNHMTIKQVLREQVNHIPQMHYFDYKTGRFAAKAREISDVKAKDWKKREESLEVQAERDE